MNAFQFGRLLGEKAAAGPLTAEKPMAESLPAQWAISRDNHDGYYNSPTQNRAFSQKNWSPKFHDLPRQRAFWNDVDKYGEPMVAPSLPRQGALLPQAAPRVMPPRGTGMGALKR